MWKYIKLLFIALMSSLFAGCTLGPLPPVPPELFSIGMIWIIIGLLIVGILFLWKNLNSTKFTRTDDLIKLLNLINKRLTNIEKKVDRLKTK